MFVLLPAVLGGKDGDGTSLLLLQTLAFVSVAFSTFMLELALASEVEPLFVTDNGVRTVLLFFLLITVVFTTTHLKRSIIPSALQVRAGSDR